LKRRDFIAATAFLSLFGSEAWAARKKAAARKKPAKGAAKKPAAPAQHTAHSADAPITEKPPQGSSASRLPPVRAPEPPTDWMTFEIATTIAVRRSSGPIRLWLPLPLNQDTLYQRTIGHRWNDNADGASTRRLPDGDLELYYCEWKAGREAKLELVTTVTTADRHFDITKRTVAPEREDILRRNLQSSTHIPNDGLAFKLGERIIGRVKDPVAQAKAIYDWVVDNTTYQPDAPAGGTGDVRRQLEQGQYGGRSADINGLFVALCRAIGIPARCVYGLRVGNSRLFKSLGVSGDATQGQHCRAEFYVPGYGWIPVDPSDVRRAIALEGLTDRDSKLTALKRVLFGVWEMNWIAYNVGTDLVLPGASERIPFFALPRVDGGERGEAAVFEHAIRTRRVEI
jgi:transglutaminase-like putative cysteine protease